MTTRKKLKDELRVANNRLEYLQDKVAAQDRKIMEMKAGNAEIQRAAEILLAQVALQYGKGDDHEMVLERCPEVLGYDSEVERDPVTGAMTIRLKKIK